MRLHGCKRQIVSAIAVAAVAAIAIVVVDGVGVNGCIPSASVPEVHVLPGRGRQRCAQGGCGVFPRGWKWRWKDKDLEALASTNDPRLSTNTHGHQTNDPRWDETTLLYQCNVCNYLVDALVPTFNFSTLLDLSEKIKNFQTKKSSIFREVQLSRNPQGTKRGQ
jgi:hypothetical protein